MSPILNSLTPLLHLSLIEPDVREKKKGVRFGFRAEVQEKLEKGRAPRGHRTSRRQEPPQSAGKRAAKKGTYPNAMKIRYKCFCDKHLWQWRKDINL